MVGLTEFLSGRTARAALAAASLSFLLVGCFEGEAPRLSGIDPVVSAKVGELLDIRPKASDPQDDPLTFAVENAPAWTTFSSDTGRLTGMPTEADAGLYPDIRLEVSDGKNITRRSFSIRVTTDTTSSETPPPEDPPETPPPPANGAPTISGSPATSINEGQAYSFKPSASDPDGDGLTFGVFNKPEWATFDAASGLLSGTPGAGDVGMHDGIVVSVSDGELSTALPAFSIMVVAVNRAPSISGTPPTRVTSGQAYSFQPTASDPEGQALTFAVANQPSWATFDTATGRLSGTPSSSAAGDYPNIGISVSDGELSSALPAFAITVVAANRAPVISGTPSTSVTAGQAYSFQPTASDPDGNTLSFSISNQPGWASFNRSTGRLSGTPTAASEGEYVDIVIRVSDGELSAALPAFSIAVEVPNRAPTISGTPPSSVTVGQAYSFQPTAADPDGDALTFSISGKPSWANFNAGTGRLSGTPASGDAGSYAGVTIRVSDGTVSASLPAFTITVQQAATGTATVSWSPPTERTDGTPLTDLAGFRVHYGRSATDLSTVITIDNAGITSYVVEGLTSGTWYFATTAFDDQGMESDFSNIASKTIP